jgi:hypothetical protein
MHQVQLGLLLMGAKAYKCASLGLVPLLELLPNAGALQVLQQLLIRGAKSVPVLPFCLWCL